MKKFMASLNVKSYLFLLTVAAGGMWTMVNAALVTDAMYFQYGDDNGSIAKGYWAVSGGSGLSVEANSGSFNWAARIGESSGNRYALVLPFQLPDLGVGGSFTSADLQISPYSKTNSVNVSIDLYGLDHADNSLNVTTADYYDGNADPENTMIQNDIIMPSTGTYYRAQLHTDASGDAALVTWLNEIYQNGSNAGKYIYLRLSPDETTVPIDESMEGYYQILTNNDPTASTPSARISYEAIAVPEVESLWLVGLAGVVMLMVCRRGKN
ncbi:hypothetical protein P3T73_10000 [Kiritimatiellota bacterium B12222]|nr:hypothetical protein P3T73_10000 [Kiritimatiellota bacterium B12222]